MPTGAELDNFVTRNSWGDKEWMWLQGMQGVTKNLACDYLEMVLSPVNILFGDGTGCSLESVFYNLAIKSMKISQFL